MLQLRTRGAEVARALPGLWGVEHLCRRGARRQEGRRFRGAGRERGGSGKGGRGGGARARVGGVGPPWSKRGEKTRRPSVSRRGQRTRRLRKRRQGRQWPCARCG